MGLRQLSGHSDNYRLCVLTLTTQYKVMPEDEISQLSYSLEDFEEADGARVMVGF